jgi:hypothetical protein
MPYIEHSERKKFRKDIESLAEKITNKGELKYVITELVGQWIAHYSLFSYNAISNAVSAVTESAMELNRRILAPYAAGELLREEDLDSFQKILKALQYITGRKDVKGL